MYHSGKLKLNNPEKYAGDPENVIYRSSWERQFYKWLDSEPNITLWGSEELAIPYKSPEDNKIHRYFPDAIATVRAGNKETTYMLEIKPYRATRPPQQGRRRTKKFLNEAITYAKNMSKWEAAREYCSKKGWCFKILTEKDLFRGNK